MTTDEMTVLKMISPDYHWKADRQTISSGFHVTCLRTNMILKYAIVMIVRHILNTQTTASTSMASTLLC